MDIPSNTLKLHYKVHTFVILYVYWNKLSIYTTIAQGSVMIKVWQEHKSLGLSGNNKRRFVDLMI